MFTDKETKTQKLKVTCVKIMYLVQYDWGLETGFMIPNAVLILP